MFEDSSTVRILDGDLEEESVADATGAEERRSRIRHMLHVVLPPLAVAAVAVGAWYFATYVVLDAQRRFLLPAPDAVIRGSFLDASSRHEILAATYNTARVAVVGLV